MNKQFFRTLKTDFRRCFRLLPGLLLTSLLLILASGLVLHYYSSLLFGKNSFQNVTLAIYMPDDTSYNQLGLSLVSNMKSFKESLNIVEVTDIEEGKEMLADGEAIVFIIIPDDFINSIMTGENNPVQVLVKNGSTFETHVVNDLLQNAASLLGCAQAAVYTVYDVGVEFDLDGEANYQLQRQVDNGNLTYVFAREDVFSTETVDALSTYTLKEQLSAAFLILILFMTCFSLTAFYKEHTLSYYIRQKSCGLGRAGVMISNCIASSLDVYLVYGVIFIVYRCIGLTPKGISFLAILPVVFLICILIRLVAECVSSPHIANLILVLAVLLLLYLAGGIMPISYMPKFLQSLTCYNPMSWLLQYTLKIVF